MLPPKPSELRRFFHILCDAAAQETLPRFRTNLDVTNKLDASFDPVTEGDQQAERVIRNLIQQHYPTHGIVGEEFGSTLPEAAFQWIIDPIDGTRAFISGLPVWGTLIGLYHDGQPIAGVMDQPFTRERYMAIDGTSSLMVGRETETAITTSAVEQLSRATLMTTSPHIFNGNEDAGYFAVEEQVKLFRYGCDCYAYCMLASGNVDIVIESGLNIYDIAALIPIIEGAGGLVTDWRGDDASKGGQILAAANATLHAEALELLKV